MVGLVLNGRGQNTACVKDTSELLRPGAFTSRVARANLDQSYF